MSKPKDLAVAVRALAEKAANSARRPNATLSRSAALAAAPWDGSFPPAWETAFREAYADRLEELGVATARRQRGGSGVSGKTVLMRRLLSATEEEFQEQDALAKAAGVSWSTWARRRLSQ